MREECSELPSDVNITTLTVRRRERGRPGGGPGGTIFHKKNFLSFRSSKFSN